MYPYTAHRPAQGRALLLAVFLFLLAGGCTPVEIPVSAERAAPVPSLGAELELSVVPEAEVGSPAVTDSASPVEEPDLRVVEPLAAAPNPLDASDDLGAGLGTPLPAAPIGFEEIDSLSSNGPAPVGLRIADLGIDEAEVIAVGVNPDETLEVPPADQVGWYRFGVRPGDAGSAVLAAHIAYDGVDGVFRHLIDAEVGSVVEVVLDDGSTQRYKIDTVVEYDKAGLPDDLWAAGGDPRLALITCGGEFNRQLRSYESNTVAIATPLA